MGRFDEFITSRRSPATRHNYGKVIKKVLGDPKTLTFVVKGE